jgi:hypothetical protein
MNAFSVIIIVLLPAPDDKHFLRINENSLNGAQAVNFYSPCILFLNNIPRKFEKIDHESYKNSCKIL